jgi:two-component system, LytTR family, sensor kinase
MLTELESNQSLATPNALADAIEPTGLDRVTLRWAVIVGVWTLLALLGAAQSGLDSIRAGRAVEWSLLLRDHLLDWYSCAVFTPAYVWLVRRYPVERLQWHRSISVLFAATCVFVVLKYLILVVLHNRFNAFATGPPASLSRVLAGNFITETLILGAVVGVLHAIEFHRRYREREVQAAQLRAELAEARLDALAVQLQPHFLFNTLHGVSTLMHRDIEAADTMLTRLSDLLRRTLRGSGRHEVPLHEELELLESYAAIMRARFGDRLNIHVAVSSEAASALVPPFICQPLVENAIQHGVARYPGPGCVEIRATVEGGALKLSVANDAPSLPLTVGGGMHAAGVASGDVHGSGIGLSNTQRRLRELYGDTGRLELVRDPAGGMIASLIIPQRPANQGSPEAPWEGVAVAGKGLGGVGGHYGF